MSKKIRVVVADDSALMRKKISDILNSDVGIEVIAATRNGKETIEVIHSLKPDVVTLDVQMPVMDGFEVLGYVMSEVPTPCIMVSAFTREGTKETIKALEFGAVDFVTKPGGVISRNIDVVGREIIEKVKVAAVIPVHKLKLIWAEKAIEAKKPYGEALEIKKVFAIASSTGGTQALATLLPDIPADLPAAILIVQHMPEGFTKSLAERLNWQSKIEVVEAADRMTIRPAQAIIAMGGKHMEVHGSAENPYVVLSDKESEMGLKPCADIMMESAAKVFGPKTIGVVLTGMGHDGTRGAEAIKKAGGSIVAEDEKSCVVYGMPRSVAEAGLVDKVAALHDVAGVMTRLVSR